MNVKEFDRDIESGIERVAAMNAESKKEKKNERKRT